MSGALADTGNVGKRKWSKAWVVSPGTGAPGLTRLIAVAIAAEHGLASVAVPKHCQSLIVGRLLDEYGNLYQCSAIFHSSSLLQSIATDRQPPQAYVFWFLINAAYPTPLRRVIGHVAGWPWRCLPGPSGSSWRTMMTIDGFSIASHAIDTFLCKCSTSALPTAEQSAGAQAIHHRRKMRNRRVFRSYDLAPCLDR
jgi:hypothetical protein